MIKSFAHRGLERFFFEGSKKGLRPEHLQKISDILDLLDAAVNVGDLNFPGSHLHPLKGKLQGRWAVRVSGNWRIVFRFENGDAFDVNYTDYH